MPWATQGVLTGPVAGTVLADMGPVTHGGPYAIGLLLSGTVGYQVFLQHRDAANSVNRWSHLIPVAEPVVSVSLPQPLQLSPGDRVRIVACYDVVPVDEEVQATLFWAP